MSNTIDIKAAIINFFTVGGGRSSGFPVAVIANRVGATEAATKKAIGDLKKEGRARAEGKFWFVV